MPFTAENISLVAGAAGALITAFWGGMYKSRRAANESIKVSNDAAGGEYERAMELVRALREDFDRAQAHAREQEMRWSKLWLEHTAVQVSLANVTNELIASRAEAAALRHRLDELEAVAAKSKGIREAVEAIERAALTISGAVAQPVSVSDNAVEVSS